MLAHLREHWSAGAGELAKATGLAWPALTEALQLGCQQGRIMYDLAADVYRFRPLTEAPLDPARLEFRDRRERIAHDLLARRGAVKIVAENRIPGTGLELTGKVAVAEDRREYRPQMLLADEGQVEPRRMHLRRLPQAGAEGGPVRPPGRPPAGLRRAGGRRLQGLDPRQAITVETRSFSRRDAEGEEVYQVSLERQRLKVRWGRGGPAVAIADLDVQHRGRGARGLSRPDRRAGRPRLPRRDRGMR